MKQLSENKKELQSVYGIVHLKGEIKMRKHRNFLLAILTVVIVILGACGSSTDESNHELDNKESENTTYKTLTEGTTKLENNSTGEGSVSTESTDVDEQEATTSEKDESSTDEENKSSSGSVEMTGSTKSQYLQKLEETKKKAEELTALDSSTYALKKVENDRWDIWDQLLNEIYGVLKEQLQPDEMEKLKEEQQKWIKSRDDRALEASLKFKGGTQEQLEYVAVLANLTEERCTELVNQYMK